MIRVRSKGSPSRLGSIRRFKSRAYEFLKEKKAKKEIARKNKYCKNYRTDEFIKYNKNKKSCSEYSLVEVNACTEFERCLQNRKLKLLNCYKPCPVV